MCQYIQMLQLPYSEWCMTWAGVCIKNVYLRGSVSVLYHCYWTGCCSWCAVPWELPTHWTLLSLCLTQSCTHRLSLYQRRMLMCFPWELKYYPTDYRPQRYGQISVHCSVNAWLNKKSFKSGFTYTVSVVMSSRQTVLKTVKHACHTSVKVWLYKMTYLTEVMPAGTEAGSTGALP